MSPPPIEHFEALLRSDDPDKLIYMMRLPDLKATIESIQEAHSKYFPEMDIGYLKVGTAKGMHDGLIKFMNDLHLSELGNPLGVELTHIHSMLKVDRGADKIDQFPIGNVSGTVKHTRSYDAYKRFLLSGSDTTLLSVMEERLFTPLLSPEERKNHFNIPEWLIDNKVKPTKQTYAFYNNKIFSLLQENTELQIADGRTEQIFDNIKIARSGSNLPVPYINKEISKSLADAVGIVPVIPQELRETFIPLSELVDSPKMKNLPSNKPKELKKYFEDLINNEPDKLIVDTRRIKLTVKDAIKKFRSEKGIETIYIHKLAAKYLTIPVMPEELKDKYVAMYEFAERIPGGGSTHQGQHRKEIEGYLLDIKRKKPSLFLVNNPQEKVYAREAIKYYLNESNKIPFLYIHKDVDAYVKENFLGKLEEGMPFIKGSKVLRKLKVQDTKENLAALKNILERIWENMDKEFEYADHKHKYGEYVKRLVAGANVGVFIHEELVGTLVTKDMVKAEASRSHGNQAMISIS